MLLNNYPHLYSSAAVDVSAVAEEVAKTGGGIYPSAAQLNRVGGKWVSMPWSMVPALIAYRKSWFDEVGAKSFPKTWREYHEVGKKLKAAKHPIGQKTVESVRFMTQFWKDAHDEGGLAWDDSNNNRAFLSGDISASLNGASIYVAALNGKDKFKTDKGAPLHTDIQHAPLPAGPKGQHGYHTAFNHMVMKYSKNAKGAIEFLRWAHKRENYEKWFLVQKGFAVGPTREWEKHAMWQQDPVMKPFQTAPQLQKRLMGYQGQPNQKAAEAWNKFIITVMYAQACSGKSKPEEAVKWAAGELGKIYTGA
jgi:multiple sugar transport system substrate-binding protein